MKQIKGKKLEFISLIKRDGTGTIMCGTEWNESMSHAKVDDMSYVDEELFRISALSLNKGTFIACNFNCFVVRLKENINAKV